MRVLAAAVPCIVCLQRSLFFLCSVIGMTSFTVKCFHELEEKVVLKRSIVLSLTSLGYVVCLITSSIYEFYSTYSRPDGFWGVDNIYSCTMFLVGVNCSIICVICTYKVPVALTLMRCNQDKLIQLNHLLGNIALERVRRRTLIWTVCCVLSFVCITASFYRLRSKTTLDTLFFALKIYPCSMYYLFMITFFEPQVTLIEDCYRKIKTILITHAEIAPAEFEAAYEKITKQLFACQQTFELANIYLNPVLAIHVVTLLACASSLVYCILKLFIDNIWHPQIIYYLSQITYGATISYGAFYGVDYYISVVNNR